MDQLLNDFSPGLFFMQSFILLGLILLMRKFAWKPILDSLQDREDDISSAIEAANAAKEEMAKLTASNENLMKDARAERDVMLKDAKVAADQMVAEAKAVAVSEGERMIEAARQAIETDKNAALTDIKNQIAMVSLDVTEKLLRRELGNKDAQKDLIESLIGETNLN